ncbi:MAG: monovalent cation/H(+) antiporter subunit G [Betaproteobacteria bacterium]|nr:monovalent cation/H(+) antiporter subunit G [Betaproteobacteria bacterium]
MSEVIYVLSWLSLTVGAAFCIIGTAGMIRMPDFFTRAHAASVPDTAGAGFLLLGMMLQAGLTLVTVKLIIIGILILFASPTATHALCKAALTRGLKPPMADGEVISKR